MHRWSPDELVLDEQDVSASVDTAGARENPDFVEDRPAGGADTFMNRLEPKERDKLYALVREEMREEIRQEINSDFGSELELIRQTLSPLKVQIRQAVDDELHAISVGAIELAVAIGERLARRTIALDDAYLVRCLEELIDRTQIGAELTVIAHPAEVAKLEQHSEVLRNLNVVHLVPEMSLEKGGCIVKAAGQEWDLTFRGQIETLNEMAHEAMLYGNTMKKCDSASTLDVVEPAEVLL